MSKNENIMNQSNQLDLIATQYHINNVQDIEIENKIQIFEFQWIKSKLKQNMKILDLGIGDGLILNLLLRESDSFNLEVHVIEGSELIFNKYNKLQSTNLFIHLGLFENYSSDTKFDLILMSHVLEHVANPIKILKHFQKFLTQNGTIIGIVPNRNSIHRKLAVYLGLQNKLDDLSYRDILVGHQRVYSIDSLKNDINKSNLNLIDLKGFFCKPFSNSQLLNFDLNIIEALLKFGEELPIEFTANLGFELSR